MKSFTRLSIIPIISIFALTTLSAQTASEIADKFIDFSLYNDEMQIKARLFVPENYDPGIDYPVVMTLHGSGESGTGNYLHILYNHMATSWGKDDFQAENPCFIFAPQCPSSSMGWSHPDVYNPVMYLLDSLMENYSIDDRRIYLTGLSMGGIGTWAYLEEDPELYAAALPVCGGIWGSSEEVAGHMEAFQHVPVWNFHGANDNVVNTNASRLIMSLYYQFDLFPLYTHKLYRENFMLADTTIERLINNHTDILYSEIPNVGHDVWNVAYQYPLAKKWLFNQRVRDPYAIIVDSEEEIITASGDVEIQYFRGVEVDSISVWASTFGDPEWTFVEKTGPEGPYNFKSTNFEDHPYRILRFIAYDTSGIVTGKGFSPFLRVDNEGNGLPYITFTKDPVMQKTNFNQDELELEVLVSDPELNSLTLAFSISYDNGANFESYAEVNANADEYYTQVFALSELSKTDSMVIKAVVSDGENSAGVQTLFFKNLGGVVVSVKDQVEGRFDVFPNPANSFINIQPLHEEVYQLQCSDLSGKLLFRIDEQRGQHNLDISAYAPGTYLLTMKSGNHLYSTKILKE